MSGETKEVFGSNYGQNDVIINDSSSFLLGDAEASITS